MLVIGTFIIISTVILIIINDGPTRILHCRNISFTSQILNGNSAFRSCLFLRGSFSSKNPIHSYPRVLFCLILFKAFQKTFSPFLLQQEDCNPFHAGQIWNLRLRNPIIKLRSHDPARSRDSGSNLRKVRFVCFLAPKSQVMKLPPMLQPPLLGLTGPSPPWTSFLPVTGEFTCPWGSTGQLGQTRSTPNNRLEPNKESP